MIGRLLPRRRIHDDASAFVDGALSPKGREAFAHHLAVCAACQSEVTQLRDTKEMLKALETAALPRSFTLSPAMAARPASRPSPTPDATGWVGLGVPRLAASVSVMMAAALIAAVVIDLDDGSSTAVLQPASQAAVAERAAPVLTETVPSTDDSAVTQVPEAGTRAESVLRIEDPVDAATPEQSAPSAVEVESAPASELEEALEEVIEEVFVAAVPELLDIFLPGSDGFGSVTLAASEAADEQTSRAGSSVPQEDAGLAVAAIQSETAAVSEGEAPAGAPGDTSLDGQAAPAAAEPPEASEDGGSALEEGEPSLVQREEPAALDASEDGEPLLDDGESAPVREEEEGAEAALPTDAGDSTADILTPGDGVTQTTGETDSEAAKSEPGGSTDVPVEGGDAGDLSDVTEPTVVVASLDEPVAIDAGPVDADVSVADAGMAADEESLAVPAVEDEAGDTQIPERPTSLETDPAVAQESSAASAAADPAVDGTQSEGMKAAPIVASGPGDSQREPAAAPTGRSAPLSSGGETGVPWLRPLQAALGIMAAFSAVLAVVVWLRRRARSF